MTKVGGGPAVLSVTGGTGNVAAGSATGGLGTSTAVIVSVGGAGGWVVAGADDTGEVTGGSVVAVDEAAVLPNKSVSGGSFAGVVVEGVA